MRPALSERPGTTSLSRRNFLRAGIPAVSVAAGVLAWGCAEGAPFPLAELEHPQLLEGLGETTVRRLGAEYRRVTPTEATMTTLMRAIADTARADRAWPWSPTASLEALVAADFAQDRVVMLDGWLLSRTEARQCALVSLS